VCGQAEKDEEGVMGYTTNFAGRFDMDRLPPAEVIVALRDLEDRDFRDRPLEIPAPSNYCQWVLTKDCKGLEWDGGEKFYSYDKWLEYIAKYILKPAGITLNGKVSFKGEEWSDRGWLVCDNGTVSKVDIPVVGDTLKELREFRDWVLTNYDEVAREWVQRR
jgi:hypothetical protein